MSALEIVAFALGVINVTLVVRRSIWNYPFALVMVLLYARIFFDAKLYSDALLQLFFFAVNLYGWWAWSRAAAVAGEVVVERLSAASRWRWAAGSAVAIIGWSSLVSRYTDAALPWWDATAAILSVVAQILMSRRLIENWVLWIVVDLLSIGLYAVKGLELTMLLYAIFLALAIWGLIDWRGAERRQRATR
ncbi:MAG: nicotinamide mononucleotide transporter [Sphingomonas sp. 28-66-16]|nr:MAG: nicotinamide mononucleotide transporter [Sphingomonas sp. 28-66-16]